jgi:uncharacterized protein
MRTIAVIIILLLAVPNIQAQQKKSSFKVIAFYTAKHDLAHISFVHEANQWFLKTGAEQGFQYDSTDNWSNMNEKYLANYQVVLFLDTRPENPEQRKAFQHYMETGGAWVGFHFSGFALTPSDYPENWPWYHQTFIGAGEYASNTWRPTSAILRIEARDHPSMKGLTETFKSAPNEWYRWKNDLTKNPDISILASIDTSSFPLGTGPKQHEIWHSGYFPAIWTNKKFRMVYMNMGHNDMDYEHGTNKTLSSTFSSPEQNKFIVNTLLWLGQKKK